MSSKAQPQQGGGRHGRHQNSAPRIRATLDEMHCWIRMNGIIAQCNDTYARKIGHSTSEVVGMSLFDHIWEGSRQSFKKMLGEVSRGGAVYNERIFMQARDSTRVEVLVNIKARYGLHARPIGAVIKCSDAAELADLQELVRIRKYESLYEGSPDMYRTINYAGTIIECNRSYQKKIGYSKKEIIGTNLIEHTAQKSRDAMSANMENWRQTGQTKTVNVWLRTKDGTEFPVTITPTNLYDDEGMLIGRNVIINDATEIHSTKQVIDELEKINRMKEEFLSAVTHELKTPLTPIIGFTQALLKPQIMGSLNPRQENTVKIILSNAMRLKCMVSDLLDAHKLELGKMRFERAAVDVAAMLDSINESFRYAIENKGITLDCRGGGGISVISDRTRIEQVIVNMVNNAIDFVPSKTGKIEVAAAGEGAFVRFTVTDNGTGIPKSKQRQLFNKFYQADTTVTRQHGGTGLGLSICKGIIENLGGGIGCESEEGVGSKFYFTIPLERSKNENT